MLHAQRFQYHRPKRRSSFAELFRFRPKVFFDLAEKLRAKK